MRLAAAATRSPGRSPAVARLPLLLWPLGAAAVAAGFYFLFDSGGDVTAVQVINRSVGGSFIACGLVAWQRRPENRTGMLMTLTGFLFLAEPLLIEVDSSGAYTLGQVVALWWAIPFTALILAFPNGRITSPIDAIIVSAFFVLEVIVQFIWVLFLPFPEGKTNVCRSGQTRISPTRSTPGSGGASWPSAWRSWSWASPAGCAHRLRCGDCCCRLSLARSRCSS